MMKKGAEELIRLAYPALRHVELVELASQNSPDKAKALASVRWPRRQARACRFLSILRRDYPESFLELISKQHPSEHARPNLSEQSPLEE